MSKPKRVEPYQGSSEFMLFLQFLLDKDRVAKAFNNLEDLRNQVNDGIDRRIKLEEAESHRASAEASAKQAEAALASAREKAVEIIDEAHEQANELMLAIKIEKDAVAEMRKNFNQYKADTEKTFSEREADLKGKLDKIETKEAKLAKETAAVIKLKEENEKKAAVLKEASSKL